jgi:hypothetical protein
MEIHGLTQFQQDLADTLWDCQDEEEIRTVIDFYGEPAYTVYQLMVAAHYDEQIQSHEDIDLAKEVLDNLCK